MIPGKVKRGLGRLARRAVEHGVPASWFGWRWARHESVPEHLAHRADGDASYEVIHPPATAEHPLPRNVADRGSLPADRGWWGFSFRDVPERTSSETFLATLPDCRIVSYRDAAQRNDFHPAILTGDGHALSLREIRFRPPHAEVLRGSGPPVRMDEATWIIERVYHNHSHWLTAHLPKILLLAERDALDDVLLPVRRTAAIDGSLRMLGLEPDSFPCFDEERPLLVGRLTVLGTDRFRPELLRLVQRAFAPEVAEPPHRRIYISRSKAPRRRLRNEDAVWPVLEDAGFERVWMEELDFEAQVRLMQQAAVVAAPHGAGLTNMVFCRPGTDIVEIADLGFPNPNFYALASGLGHPYWLVEAEPVGDGPPLERDMRVDPTVLARLLPRIVEGRTRR